MLSRREFLTGVAVGPWLAGGCRSEAASPEVPPGVEEDPEDRLQVELEALRREYGLPGATAAFILPLGTLGAVATGMADRDTGLEMEPHSRMLAASIGKSFVAATVLDLSRGRELGLDDPLTRWLSDRPWLPRIPSYDAITVRHLLTHTSGLPDHVYTAAFAEAVRARWNLPGNAFPPETLVSFILDRDAAFAPGSRWAYSDTGYVLLGMVIEAVTGSRWQHEVLERFLVPLHLADTTPSDRRTLPGLATGYVPPDNRLGLPASTTIAPGVMAWNPALEDAGGGLASTPSDLVRWGRALFEGGAMAGDYLPDLLRSVPTDSDGSVRYGLGVAIREWGPFGRVWGHAGRIPGYTSSLRYYPDHRVAIAFQTNADAALLTRTRGDSLARIEHRLVHALLGRRRQASSL